MPPDPRGRSTFTDSEVDALREAMTGLHSSDDVRRGTAHQVLNDVGLDPRDWVHPGNVFDSFQFERRLADGSIRVVSDQFPALPTPANPRGPLRDHPRQQLAAPIAESTSEPSNAPFAAREVPPEAKGETRLGVPAEGLGGEGDIDPRSRVIEMLQQDGVSFALGADGHVRVAGQEVDCRPSATETLDDVKDRVAFIVHGHELRASLVRRLPIADLEVRMSETSYGLELRRAGQLVARVRCARALVDGGEDIVGPFHQSGRHWSRLIAYLAGDVPRLARVAGSRRVQSRDIHDARATALLAPSEREAVAASAALLTERSVAYGHSVDLLADDVHLRLLPLRRRQGRLEAPFASRLASGSLFAGALVLEGRCEVLPLWEFARSGLDVGHHWLLALNGLKELTCVERIDDPAIGARSGRRERRRLDGRLGPKRLEERLFGRRSSLLHGARLSPTPETLRWAAGYVAGHRRQLQPGQSASAEATARAADVGIKLASDETWVRPHTRGAPADAVLSFVWDAPSAISS
jgi:hypothetical protein